MTMRKPAPDAFLEAATRLKVELNPCDQNTVAKVW